MKDIFINATLSKNEEIKSLFPLHWIVWLKVVFPSILFLFTLPLAIYHNDTYGSMAFWFFPIVFLFVAVCSALNIIGTEYAITNKRLIGKTGFIFRNNIDIRLVKLESVILDQSILGRIFGYGNIVFNGTGSGKSAFISIDNPMLAKNLINQILEDLENEKTEIRTNAYEVDIKKNSTQRQEI